MRKFSSPLYYFLFIIPAILVCLPSLRGVEGAIFHDLVHQYRIKLQTERPIVHGDENDKYPDTITVKGKIKQVTLTHAYCGLIRNFGTMKIEVIESPNEYTDKYVYLVVPCLFDPRGEGAFLEKDVCVHVTKLYKTSFDSGIINVIDSGGVPFYYLSWSASRKKDFFEQMVCPSNARYSQPEIYLGNSWTLSFA